MRLSRTLRVILYAALAVLLATGIAWLVIDATKDPFQAGGGGEVGQPLLAVHGGAAMAFLIVFGALLPLHVQSNWARDRNRWAGVVMLAVNAVLIVTAYALYYSGSDVLRARASDVHIAAGLFLPLWLGVHIWLGWRTRVAAQRALADADWQ
ncbi:MAG: hypothetical protein JO128_11995 [Alphaproteobacteria bacterium]|nr:hypothetical protein [Alphaproteobacteria bacterium]